ncbi:hypothetical protein Tco_1323620, partial [Tanacetum coccineum]
MIDEPMVKKMQSSLVDTTNVENTSLGSYPPLPTQGTTPAGNTPGKSSSSYVRAMIELQADVELKDTIVMAMPKLFGEGLGAAKILTKPNQALRGVPVGPKVGFKLVKEYRHVSKKLTTNTSVVKDEELGTNGGTSNLASNRANSSGTSFWNMETSSTSTTPIVDKIGKLEQLIIEGIVTLVDAVGKPMKKVDYSRDHDSDDEVCSVDNDMACSMA